MATTLLVVEPSLTTRKVVELAFEEEGVEIALALTGAEALEQVGRARPSAILASFVLPDMSGIELCRSVREAPHGSGVPVILLVGHGERYDEDEARAAGVTARLNKPLDSEELVELVEQYAVEGEPLPPASAEEATPPEREHVEPSVAVPPVAELVASSAAGQAPSSEEEGEEPPGEVADEASAPEAVAIEGEELEGPEDETDFERSLQSLSEEILAADAVSGEPGAVGEAEPAPEGAEAGIELEKVTDEEIRDTMLEGEDAAIAPPAAQGPPASIRRQRVGEEARRAGRRPEAEADLIERLIGRRVWEFTEEAVRQSMQQTLDRVSPEIIGAIRDEVRALFPRLAERIIREEIDKLKKGLDS
jgi:CheY-like chemotaxis protein